MLKLIKVEVCIINILF